MKLDILAFAAHPDDVELSASGTLLHYAAQGKKIGIIDLTEAAAKKINVRKVGLAKVKIKIIGFENELMLIPYHQLELETTPKFSKKFYQKTRLKYKKKYRIKQKIKHKRYLKKGKKPRSKMKIQR